MERWRKDTDHTLYVFGVPYEVDPASSDIAINNKDDRLPINTDLRDSMSFFNT